MKKKYIITQARTQSEWDGVDFALIEVTKGLINQAKQVSKLLERSSKLIDSVGIWADNVKFFTDVSQLPESFDLEITDETCLVIELSDKDYVKLSQAEQQMRGGEMRFYTVGGVVFTTSGKHTGEEYWCNIKIDFFKNLKL